MSLFPFSRSARRSTNATPARRHVLRHIPSLDALECREYPSITLALPHALERPLTLNTPVLNRLEAPAHLLTLAPTPVTSGPQLK